MLAEINRTRQSNNTFSNPIVVVGTGPIGIRTVDELLKINPETEIVIYGDEPREPYNRVGLSSLLAGEISISDIDNPIRNNEIKNLVQHFNCSVTHIDRKNKVITDSLGRQQNYHKLVLAIGSRPRKPNIPGINLPHVYTFRDIKDVDKLFARRMRTRQTVVIGGGLLGLEAARAMQKYNTQVTIVEHSNRLMSRQLNDELADMLLESIISLKIKVCLKTNVKKIIGEIGVTGLELNNGKILECDTIIVATGVVPNKELAQNAGVIAGRGIKVNDLLQTSDQDIYSVGECCEHRGETYGLVAPGFEQAAVCAQVLQGNSASYQGSVNVSKLKVFNFPIYSIGEVGDDAENISNQISNHRSDKNKSSHTLIVRHRRLVGAMGIGDWPEFERIQEAIRKRRRIWPWQISSFCKTGLLWSENSHIQVSHWPTDALVCNCKNISRGELSTCINQGAKTLQRIQFKTGASTVCGTCEPLVASLLGETKKISPQLAYRTLATLSLVVTIAIIIHFLSPAIPYSSSAQSFQFDIFWTDALLKQISGYTLAGATILGVIVLSLRKRLNIKKLGNLAYWRVTHISLSLFALSILILHTGLNAASNLNFVLLLFFVLTSTIGIVSTLTNALEHKLSPYLVKQWRGYSNKLHIIFSWPLPVLLGFHIISTYYF